MKKRCSVWGDKFWNDFFHPRHPGVFLVLLDIVGAIAYTCCYVLLAIYFGALCNDHADSYLIIFISNLSIILVGFLVIHFLTMRPDQLTIIRCALLYLGQLFAIVLGVTAIIKFHDVPTNEEMKKYIQQFSFEYNRVPRIMERLQQEKKCCGVFGIGDFIKNQDWKNKNVTRIPDSCCVKWTRYCGDFKERNQTITPTELNTTSPDYFKTGCFSKSQGFADLAKLSPTSYENLFWVKNVSYFNLLFTIIIFLVYSYYVCYKLPKEDERPDWGDGEFIEKCMVTPFRCFSQPKVPPQVEFDSVKESFERRHSAIGASLNGGSTDNIPLTSTNSGSVATLEPDSPNSPTGIGSMEKDLAANPISSSTEKIATIVPNSTSSEDKARGTEASPQAEPQKLRPSASSGPNLRQSILDANKKKKASAQVPADKAEKKPGGWFSAWK